MYGSEKRLAVNIEPKKQNVLQVAREPASFT